MNTKLSTDFLIKASELKAKKDIDKVFKSFLNKCKTEEDQLHIIKSYKLLISDLNTTNTEAPPMAHSPSISSSLPVKPYKTKTNSRDERLQPVIVKPPEKPYNLSDAKREEVNTKNIFKGKGFDINEFNNMFENIKAQNEPQEGVKYGEDMQCYDFQSDSFTNFQPIIEYAGIIVPDEESYTHNNYSISNTYTYNLDEDSFKNTKPKYNKDYSDNAREYGFETKNPIRNIDEYNTIKENNIRKELEEKRRKVQNSLHLYENQSSEQLMSIISNYNPDKIIRKLTKGPFE